MSKPKRHHWWPQLQSGHWTDDEGCINRIDREGEILRTQPINIGVKGHLYSKIQEDGLRDPEIEIWLAQEIDSPFEAVFDKLFDFSNLQKIPDKPDQKQKRTREELGFRVNNYREFLISPNDTKQVLVNYISALLVRSPSYLKILVDFHKRENSDLTNIDPKNLALENMKWLYQKYREAISKANLMFIIKDCENEFIYGDRAVVAQEPWQGPNFPFDIHVPLTPDFSVEVLPTPKMYFRENILVSRVGNIGVARFNKIVLGNSQRFVFTRQKPPLNFILKNFGVPAPKAYGRRIIDGRIETKYDRTRDKR